MKKLSHMETFIWFCYGVDCIDPNGLQTGTGG